MYKTLIINLYFTILKCVGLSLHFGTIGTLELYEKPHDVTKTQIQLIESQHSTVAQTQS